MVHTRYIAFQRIGYLYHLLSPCKSKLYLSALSAISSSFPAVLTIVNSHNSYLSPVIYFLLYSPPCFRSCFFDAILLKSITRIIFSMMASLHTQRPISPALVCILIIVPQVSRGSPPLQTYLVMRAYAALAENGAVRYAHPT